MVEASLRYRILPCIMGCSSCIFLCITIVLLYALRRHCRHCEVVNVDCSRVKYGNMR